MDGSSGPPPHHQHPQMQPPMQQPMYQYPVDPAWAAQHGMIPMHHMHNSYLQHMDGMTLPPGLPGLTTSSDPLEAVLGPFPCTMIRMLPFDATLEDVLVFFQGLVVLDVVMHAQGEAFIVFANPMDFQMALQRDHHTIGGRYIEVLQGKRADYYAAIAMKHLRYAHIHQHIGERATGEITNDLDGMSSDAQPWSPPIQALQIVGADGVEQLEGQRRSNRPQQHAGRGAGRGSGAQPKRAGGGIQVGEHTGFLRMRGLPFSSTKQDIFNFFKIYKPVEDSIVLTFRSDGRATGEGYVGFEGAEHAEDAMTLHKSSMGSRYIELFISNKDEHGRALTRFGGR